MSRKYVCIATVLFTIFLSATVHAEEKSTIELGLGAGSSLNGFFSRQLLLAPAASIPIDASSIWRFRLEADLEFIEKHGRLTAVAGIAPFIRAHYPADAGSKVSPFLEAGAGINYASRKHLEIKELDGPFLFSLMGGAGIEFHLAGRPASVSYRVRHLSNAHTYRRNHGINAHYIMFSLGF